MMDALFSEGEGEVPGLSFFSLEKCTAAETPEFEHVPGLRSFALEKCAAGKAREVEPFPSHGPSLQAEALDGDL